MSRRENTVRSNRRDSDRDETSQSRRNLTDSVPSPRRRKWPWFLLALLVLIFFLPNILAMTSLKQMAVDRALSDFKGKVNVGGASFGWLQPVTLSNVSAVDEQGQPLLEVAKVKTSKTLGSFLFAKEYGTVTIEQPVVHLVLRQDGSNLEDAISNYLQSDPNEPESPEASELPRVHLMVIDGIAQIVDATSNESWQVDGLNLDAKTLTDVAAIAAEMQCKVKDTQNNAGQLALTTHVDPGGSALEMQTIQLALNSSNCPMSIAAPVLGRFIGPAKTSGLMSGQLQCVYSTESHQAGVDVTKLSLQQASFQAPSLIGRDVLFTQNLTANGRLNLTPTIVKAEGFEVVSDIADINANGQFDVGELSSLASGGQLLGTPFELNGEINFARLAAMLPETLKLHEDLNIESGKIVFSAGSRNENQDRRMVWNMDAMNFRATRGNQNIIWQKPIHINGSIRQSGGFLGIEKLECTSDFLTVKGSGTIQSGSMIAKGDLSKLMQRAGQFVDLQGFGLAGILDGELAWSMAANGNNPNDLTFENRPIEMGGQFTINNPVIQSPGLAKWQPDQLQIGISATGQSQTGNRVRLDDGGIQVTIGSEQLTATLAEPIADVSTHQNWKLQTNVQGSIRDWLAHIRNFVELEGFEAAGNLNLNTLATISPSIFDPQVIQFANAKFDATELGFDGYGMMIREPKVVGDANGSYEMASGLLTASNLNLASGAVSLGGKNLQLLVAEQMKMAGQVAYRADVNRVSDWFGISPNADDMRFYGSAEGTLNMNASEQGIGFQVQTKLADLVAATPVRNQQSGQQMQLVGNQVRWSEMWREPVVNVDSQFIMGYDFDSLNFEALKIDSKTLKVDAQGTLNDLAGTLNSNMRGTWDPDWELINQLLDSYTGETVKLVGNGQKPFELVGPIFPAAGSQVAGWIHPALRARTAIGWERGQVMFMPIGQSNISLDLNGGVANVHTEGIPFAEGLVKLAPQIDLRTQSPMLVLNQGMVAQNLTLTRDNCRQWMKYITPLAADATAAQGKFSVHNDQLQVPLLDPMNMSARGTIRLSDVTIGPGPMADQLLATVNQVRSIIKPDRGAKEMKQQWLQVAEQDIPFTVQNQRVFHENVTFTHKDMQISTSGSVGLDQTVNMVARIPINPSWVAGQPYLAGLADQSISIPITGTLSKPRLDRRAIQQLSTDLVKKAAGSALNKAVTDKLAPKVGEFQNKVNDRLGNELNKVQNKLNDSIQEKIGNQLENELKSGLNNLFNRGGK